MRKCDICLAPVLHAAREVGGERMVIDLVPILGGDVVVREEHGRSYAKVTTTEDCDAMYKRHVCRQR